MTPLQRLLILESRRAIANFYSHKRAHRSGIRYRGVRKSECPKCRRTGARIIRNGYLMSAAFAPQTTPV